MTFFRYNDQAMGQPAMGLREPGHDGLHLRSRERHPGGSREGPSAICAIRIFELAPTLLRPLLLSMRRFALPAAKRSIGTPQSVIVVQSLTSSGRGPGTPQIQCSITDGSYDCWFSSVI